MWIDQPDVLRSWLAATLAPICDADPAALAKYVMALLKKDKPEQELKDFCIDQLDVFLQKETKTFVEKLFAVVKDRSYAGLSDAATEACDFSMEHDQVRGKGGGGRASSSDERSLRNGGLTSGRRRSRSRERQQQSSRGTRMSSSSPARSRGQEHQKRQAYFGGTGPAKYQALTGRDRDRDKENRDVRQHDRGSPAASSTAVVSSSREREQRRPPSKEAVAVEGNVKPPTEAESPSPCEVKVPTEKDKKRRKPRCRDFDEKGYCMRGDNCPFDHGPDPVVVEDLPLPNILPTTLPSASNQPIKPPPAPNFSVPPPGYIPVHPPPPGVDSSTFQPEAYNPEAPSLTAPATVPTAAVPALPYSQPPPPLWTRPPPALMPYGPAFAGLRQPAVRSRELITLAEGHQVSTGMEVAEVRQPVAVNRTVNEGTIGRKRPPSDRMGGNGRTFPSAYDRSNRTLEIRRIPLALNTITKLNEHFSQFGQITNIQVRYDGDPEAALITYANREMAVAAYRSTSPILNNRFIKVFWHQADAGHSTTSAPADGSHGFVRSSVKDRLGTAAAAPVAPSVKIPDVAAENANRNGPVQPVVVGRTLTKTVINAEAVTALGPSNATNENEPEAELPRPGKLALRKEDKFKEALKKSYQLQKAKVDLIDKQVKQEKLLLKKLEGCKSADQKKKIIETIKMIEKNIETMKDNLQAVKIPHVNIKTREQLEREMLDMELEMISQQQVGGDTTDLQRRLTELRNEITLLTSSDGISRLESGRSFVPGAAGHLRNKKIPRSATLDKRPRDLLISGFMFEERDMIIDHFQKFGALEDIEYLPNKEKSAMSKAIILYKARKDAEVAFALGSDFLGRKLEIQWASSVKAAQQAAAEEGSASQEMSAEAILASLDDDFSEEENQLIDENEEEEGGEEERAWKR